MAKITLRELSGDARMKRILAAIDEVLGRTDVPLRTAELVKRMVGALAGSLGPGDGEAYVARELNRLAGHPLRRPTGETFVKFGRTMPRYEWLPSHKAGTPTGDTLTPAKVHAMIDVLERGEAPADPEREWRAYRIAEVEAGRPDPGPWVAPDAGIDAWTVQPEPVAEEPEPAGEWLDED